MATALESCLRSASEDLCLDTDGWRPAPIKPVGDAQFFSHRDRTRFVLRVQPAERAWTCFDGHEFDEAAWREPVAGAKRPASGRAPRTVVTSPPCMGLSRALRRGRPTARTGP
jgi:hypothetical protein